MAEPAQLLGFAALAALAFTAIVQALVALFGNRGWILALLFLVIQVAASGVPLTGFAAPGPLAALGTFMPLTYAIDAFQGAIAGGRSNPAIDAVVLGAWLLGGVLVTLAVAAGLERGEAGAKPGTRDWGRCGGRPGGVAAPRNPGGEAGPGQASVARNAENRSRPARRTAVSLA